VNELRRKIDIIPLRTGTSQRFYAVNVASAAEVLQELFWTKKARSQIEVGCTRRYLLSLAIWPRGSEKRASRVGNGTGLPIRHYAARAKRASAAAEFRNLRTKLLWTIWI